MVCVSFCVVMSVLCVVTRCRVLLWNVKIFHLFFKLPLVVEDYGL